MSKLIPLGGKNGKGKFAIVDDEDYEWAIQQKWYLVKGYAQRTQRYGGKQITIYLHREIVKRQGWEIDDMQIDHANHNKLDNIRKNLRIATPQQNSRNRKGPMAHSKSGFLGVSPVSFSNQWRACIGIGEHNNITIGLFDTPEKAALARDWAASHYFGEYATLNFPDEIPYLPAQSTLRSNSTSGFRGVSWHKGRKKWIARIGANNIRKHLGCFDTPEEAGRAYDKGAKELHGKRARLNFPNN